MTGPSRRRFLALAATGVAALAGSGCAVVRRPAVLAAEPAARPLAVPPLAPSRIDRAGRRVFDLTAAQGRTSFLPGTSTPTWGFDQPFGGPTLRATRGEQVLVRVRNDLAETTTVHWHGMHLPAGADGGPHQPVRPGRTWEPTWRIDQPAATLWYHPHPHGRTEAHMYQGLVGMFLIDDERSAALALPRRYGVDDIPLVVTDRTFREDGTFDVDDRNAHGLLGDTLLVNGTVAPFFDVTTERVRLRLLNASSARCYRFALSDDRPVDLIATDGGLLDAPRQVGSVLLTPGERAEIVVAVAPGARTVLRSLPQDLGTVGSQNRSAGGDDTFDVLELRSSARPTPSPRVPARLAEPDPDTGAVLRTRRFELHDDTINGQRMDMNRVDEIVTAGTVEQWEVTNRHSRPHNFHVHDVRFTVLDIDGHPPSAENSGPRDTVYIPPRATVRLRVPFGRHTDPAMPYMYHCHLLYHEDQGMMGQFVVVAPGQQAGTRIATPATAGGEHDHG